MPGFQSCSQPHEPFVFSPAEIIKYGLIRDAPLFEWLEANMGRLLARDPEVRCASAAFPAPT